MKLYQPSKMKSEISIFLAKFAYKDFGCFTIFIFLFFNMFHAMINLSIIIKLQNISQNAEKQLKIYAKILNNNIKKVTDVDNIQVWY